MKIEVETDADAIARYETARKAVEAEKSVYLKEGGTKLNEKVIDKFFKRMSKFERKRVRAKRTLVIGKREIPLLGKRVKYKP